MTWCTVILTRLRQRSGRWWPAHGCKHGKQLLLLALLPMAMSLQAAEPLPVAIYTHDSVKDDFLTRPVLRSVFTMRARTWPDGTPVRVFVLGDDDPLHVRFCQEWLGTFPYVLRKSWNRSTYTGTGLVPRTVATIEEMQRLIDRTPGAVGYVPSAEGIEQAAPQPSLQHIHRTL